MNSSGYGGTSSSSGALLQLLAVGAMDSLLTKGATKTFWKPAYAKATAFSLESINQAFTGSPSWGGESSITLNRSGDLLFKQFIKIILPGLTTQKRDDSPNVVSQPAFPSSDCDGQKCADLSVYLSYVGEGYTAASDGTKQQMLDDGKKQWEQVRYGCAPAPLANGATLFDAPEYDAAWWTEATGFACIKRLELKIGGSVIDCNWAELMFVIEELSGHSGKKLTEMVNRTFRSVDRLIANSRETQILYVPVGFWYTAAPSLALPLACLQFHNVHLNVQWAPLSSLVMKSMCDLVVLRSDTGMPLGDSDLQASVESVYVHLSTDERDSLIAAPGNDCYDKRNDRIKCPPKAQGGLHYLITQSQAKKITVNSSNLDVQLGMSFCVSALMFCIRRKSAREANDLFNFSGIAGRAPLINAALAFNSTTRVAAHPEVWWRLVQPYMHWPSLPLARIYSYSFALQPSVVTEPSGCANFSRLDNVSLELQLQDEFGAGSQEDAELFVFARNFNLLKICAGMCSVCYSS